MKKILSILLASVLTVTTFASCGNSQNSENSKTHLNFGCYNYSDSLDPATNVNSSWCGVRYGITECLFKFSKDVVAEPNICDSFEKNDEATIWTLHIRDNVKFSNGNDVTATAVKNSLERIYNETDSSKGGKGNSNPDGYLVYQSIEADDSAGTITITCEKPTPNMTGILSYPYFAIIDTTVADKEIIGTGPYKVKKSNKGISLDTVKNENYWNGDVPFESMTLLFIEDASTKAMALQSGDIDLAENITTASDLKTLEQNDKFYIDTAAGVRTGNSYMNFNGVLKNDSLRQAILMALDSQTMCDVTVGGMYTSGISCLPSTLSYNYDNLTNPYDFDVKKAITLLDNANIKDTDGDGYREIDGKNINLDYVAYSSRNLADFAQAIAIQLEEIGVKVTVNVRDYDTALALQNAGEFDLITANSITVGVGDPQDFLGNWYSKNSQNYGYYKSQTFDKAFEKLMVELDNDTRVGLIEELQQILINDAATIVHGYYNSRMFSNSDVVDNATIATIDYYWITNEIAPKE